MKTYNDLIEQWNKCQGSGQVLVDYMHPLRMYLNINDSNNKELLIPVEKAENRFKSTLAIGVNNYRNSEKNFMAVELLDNKYEDEYLSLCFDLIESSRDYNDENKSKGTNNSKNVGLQNNDENRSKGTKKSKNPSIQNNEENKSKGTNKSKSNSQKESQEIKSGNEKKSKSSKNSKVNPKNEGQNIGPNQESNENKENNLDSEGNQEDEENEEEEDDIEGEEESDHELPGEMKSRNEVSGKTKPKK